MRDGRQGKSPIFTRSFVWDTVDDGSEDETKIVLGG